MNPAARVPGRGLALALTVLTGFSALVNEVVWQRALATLLGSHGEATAAVLAIFLGGLAAGYAAFGALCRRTQLGPAALLGLYAAVEGAIGVHALAFPALFSLARSASVALPAGGFAGDVLLCAALLGPPTVLMGATIPLLTEALAGNAEEATSLHARVYGWNTVGAWAGALCGGFLLLPTLGIPGSLRATAVVNLAVAAGLGAIARRHAGRPRVPTPPEAQPDRRALAPEAAAALALGFAAMALQTVIVRVAGLAFGASEATFAIVVSTFVLCIALGSLAVSRLRRVPATAAATAALILAVLLAGLYPWLEDASFAAHRLRVLIPDDTTGFHLFRLAAAGLVLVTLALPLAISGALLPLLFHDLRRRHGALGSTAGRLYAWNTVGSVAGALAGGWALLLVGDLHHVYRVAVGAVVLACLALAGRHARRPARVLRGASFLLLAVLVALPAWKPERMSTAHLRLRQAAETVHPDAASLAAEQHGLGVIFATDDPTTTVLVNEHEDEDHATSRALFTNGKSDGSLWPDYPTMALTGLLPCVLAESCRSAFVIGLGTGVTAGELGAVTGMERVVVAEISRGVAEAVVLFAEGNQGVHTNPKVEVHHGDAYRTLLRSRERFDVIASEPSHPWASGVEMLFAFEFLEAARERLAPGGVYAQWMHAYEMDDATLAMVLRTYAAVFPRTAVWYAAGPDLLLLGFREPEAAVDAGRVQRRTDQLRLAPALARAGVSTLPMLLAHELVPAGLLDRAAQDGPLHTLLHPRLGHAAQAAYFRDDHARLPAVPEPRDEVGGLAQLEAQGALDESDYEDVVRHLCETRDWECPTLLARWRHRHPGSQRALDVGRELEELYGVHLLASRVELLLGLYEDGFPSPVDAESASRVTDHFEAYYHPVFPFRREALERTLARCEGDGCEAVQRNGRARLAAREAGVPQNGGLP